MIPVVSTVWVHTADDQYANCGTIVLKVWDLTSHDNQRSTRNELQHKTSKA